MRALVTGVAGFIGSHLAEKLLVEGHEVLGLDAFTEYYDRRLKEQNLSRLCGRSAFRLIKGDIATANLPELLRDQEVVFHLAAQPGVRKSWGDDFRIYLERNLWATQRLLEEARHHPLHKFVFASSSSIYGDAERYPTAETDLPQPISPYGVTKLAGERLCLAYASSYGVPIMAMRYFTVYGPRQRPDMAFSRFIGALKDGSEISIYGDGRQTRDFTYVSDAVEATYQAGVGNAVNDVLNIGGGSRVTVLEVLAILGEISGQEPRLRFVGTQRGDVHDTAADVRRANAVIGYEPRTSLRTGLQRQVEHAVISMNLLSTALAVSGSR
jgi:nucleoside-diphosphate-sugar epimerase